MYRPQNKIT